MGNMDFIWLVVTGTYSLVYNVNVRCCIFLPNKPLFCSQTQCSVASTQIWIVNLANVCYFCRVRYLNHRWYLQHRLQWSPIGTCKNFSFKVKKQVCSKHPRYKGVNWQNIVVKWLIYYFCGYHFSIMGWTNVEKCSNHLSFYKIL